jgi:prophage antirepressor-like protein
MNREQALVAFEQHSIRRFFDDADETWYFSVVDVVAALTDSVNPRDYWFKMKIRVKTQDGFQLSTICRQLKMKAPDGKMRETDCANVEGLLRIIQSIPSPKAEPFKQWLARVGYERIQDMGDPARSLDRAREYWQQHGRSEKWIQQRMMGQETRNKLTDYWKDHEIKGEDEFAIPDQYHSSGMERGVGQKAQDDQGAQNPEPARPHERGGTYLHRSGGNLHPADCPKR